MAHRASPGDPFDPPTLVAEASSPLYETSPAISRDGLSLYVGSDRDGTTGGIGHLEHEPAGPKRGLVGAGEPDRARTPR